MARYAQTAEFLDVWHRLMAGERVDYQGEYICAEGAELLFPPVQQNGPPLYIGGSSDAAMAITAEHIDWFLSWGEPPALLQEKIARMKDLAAKAGREVRCGIRLHIIVRETEEAAWAEADRLISRLDDADVARAQATQAGSESVGQRRMQALHGGSRDNLVIAPNLWAGVGLIRGGAGTALVGSPDALAERIAEYAELGIETFILSGYPHLEEAYRTAELLFPHLTIAETDTQARPIPPGQAGEAGGYTLSRGEGTATGPS